MGWKGRTREQGEAEKLRFQAGREEHGVWKSREERLPSRNLQSLSLQTSLNKAEKPQPLHSLLEANPGLVYNNKDLFISPLLPKHPLSISPTSDPVFVILQSPCSSFQPLKTLKKHFLTKFVCHVPARRHGRLKHPNIKATSEQPHFTLNLVFIPRANTLKLYSL